MTSDYHGGGEGRKENQPQNTRKTQENTHKTLLYLS